MVTGKRNAGKSAFCSQLISQAMQQGYVTGVYSGESCDEMITDKIQRQIAGPDRVISSTAYDGGDLYSVDDQYDDAIAAWLSGRFALYDRRKQRATPAVILDRISALAEWGARVILVDNLMSALAGSGDRLYAAQGDFAWNLAEIAVQMGILIILVAHPRKTQDGEIHSTDDVSGNGVIMDAADYGLTYSRRAEPEGKVVADVQLTKNRLTGVLTDKIPLSFEPKSVRIYEPWQEPYWGWDTDGLFPLIKPKEV